ncbi:hypothetical protein [Streptomyces microflavus]|uniref:hypothetical protein n=1 Tax=Streptomyces microflavus TaxID=1919 RepID=UPI0033F40C1F
MTANRTSAPYPPPYRIGRVRTVARVLAIVSCVPYVGLKAAWMAGSRVGIPDGSPLLDGGALLVVGNGVTVLMDACVVVLALLLTRPWGLRVPAWLLVVPMWVASGLLLPVMTAERTSDFSVAEAVNALFVGVSVAGALLLAFRRGGRLPLGVPLVLVWAGSAQVACWGGWLSLAAPVGAGDVAERPTTAMVLIYAVQLLVGTLIALAVAHLLAERAATPNTSGTRA